MSTLRGLTKRYGEVLAGLTASRAAVVLAASAIALGAVSFLRRDAD